MSRVLSFFKPSSSFSSSSSKPSKKHSPSILASSRSRSTSKKKTLNFLKCTTGQRSRSCTPERNARLSCKLPIEYTQLSPDQLVSSFRDSQEGLASIKLSDGLNVGKYKKKTKKEKNRLTEKEKQKRKLLLFKMQEEKFQQVQQINKQQKMQKEQQKQQQLYQEQIINQNPISQIINSANYMIPLRNEVNISYDNNMTNNPTNHSPLITNDNQPNSYNHVKPNDYNNDLFNTNLSSEFLALCNISPININSVTSPTGFINTSPSPIPINNQINFLINNNLEEQSEEGIREKGKKMKEINKFEKIQENSLYKENENNNINNDINVVNNNIKQITSKSFELKLEKSNKDFKNRNIILRQSHFSSFSQPVTPDQNLFFLSPPSSPPQSLPPPHYFPFSTQSGYQQFHSPQINNNSYNRIPTDNRAINNNHKNNDYYYYCSENDNINNQNYNYDNIVVNNLNNLYNNQDNMVNLRQQNNNDNVNQNISKHRLSGNLSHIRTNLSHKFEDHLHSHPLNNNYFPHNSSVNNVYNDGNDYYSNSLNKYNNIINYDNYIDQNNVYQQIDNKLLNNSNITNNNNLKQNNFKNNYNHSKSNYENDHKINNNIIIDEKKIVSNQNYNIISDNKNNDTRNSTTTSQSNNSNNTSTLSFKSPLIKNKKSACNCKPTTYFPIHKPSYPKQLVLEQINNKNNQIITNNEFINHNDPFFNENNEGKYESIIDKNHHNCYQNSNINNNNSLGNYDNFTSGSCDSHKTNSIKFCNDSGICCHSDEDKNVVLKNSTKLKKKEIFLKIEEKKQEDLRKEQNKTTKKKNDEEEDEKRETDNKDLKTNRERKKSLSTPCVLLSSSLSSISAASPSSPTPYSFFSSAFPIELKLIETFKCDSKTWITSMCLVDSNWLIAVDMRRCLLFSSSGFFISFIGSSSIHKSHALQLPNHVTNCNHQMVAVSDKATRNIKIYSLDDQLISVIEDDLLRSVTGMAFHLCGSLFITTTKPSQVYLFNFNHPCSLTPLLNPFLKRTQSHDLINSQSTSNLLNNQPTILHENPLLHPYCLVINPLTQDMVIGDDQNNMVISIATNKTTGSTDGKISWKYPEEENEETFMFFPVCLCCDSKGSVFVGDSRLNLILVLNSEGHLLKRLATSLGGMGAVCSLCCYSDKEQLIVSNQMSCIKVFDLMTNREEKQEQEEEKTEQEKNVQEKEKDLNETIKNKNL